MKIFNVNVYGLEEAIRASGYPKRTEFFTVEDKDKSFQRAVKLGNVSPGSGHDAFLKGIIVQFDVQYTAYWGLQFSRYHFADIVSSSSKMFKLTKMNVNECCNRYTVPTAKVLLQTLIDMHEHFDELTSEEGWEDPQARSSFGSVGRMVAFKDSGHYYVVTKGDLFNMIISNCPMGLELTMRVSTNYMQLKTMWKQRHNTDAIKLPDDWGVFVRWIETLPYFKEMCLGGEKVAEIANH
jgi:hypothetical protein